MGSPAVASATNASRSFTTAGFFFHGSTPPAPAAHPLVRRTNAALQFVDTASNSSPTQTGNLGHCQDAAMPTMHRQQAAKQPPLAFIQRSHHAIDRLVLQRYGATRMRPTFSAWALIQVAMYRQVGRDHDFHP
jgi:hypothetical protein